MYKKCPDHPIFGEMKCVIRTTDNAIIPPDFDNTDYQAYLAWVALGNVADPAEEQV